jgi:hypothetical protein
MNGFFVSFTGSLDAAAFVFFILSSTAFEYP